MSLADDIDIASHDAYLDGVPFEQFARLRAEAPVFWHKATEPEQPQQGFWAITRHADCVRINRQWEGFSSQRKGALLTQERPDLDMARMMLELDPPEHTRLRQLVSRGFTPKVIKSMDGHFREVADEIIGGAVASGTFDFVTDIAAELPLYAIAQLLGLPQEDRHKVFKWSNAMIGSNDPEYQGADDMAANAMAELYMYANALAAERKIEPKQDIITTLLEADGDQQLSEHEFDMFVMLLSVAGNETTRNATAQGMLAFLENPDQWTLLKSDPAKYLDGAIEEVLRYGTPVMNFRRTATSDLELHGQQIKEGDAVVMYYISADRDTDVFTDPDTFDITRSPNPHLAFGGGGPHHCLGVSLARLEMRIMFEVLLDHVDHFTLAGTPSRLRSNFIHGLKHLDVAAVPA
ncbi:MAG TPA: cytochrome P450 [Ilumatobacteraceae bacterium]